LAAMRRSHKDHATRGLEKKGERGWQKRGKAVPSVVGGKARSYGGVKERI